MSAIGPEEYLAHCMERLRLVSSDAGRKMRGHTPIMPKEAASLLAELERLQRLARPDPAEVRGRIRQVADRYYLGPFRCGQIVPTMGGEWIMYTVNAEPTPHPTEAAARAALVAAVREAIETQQETT